MMSNWFERYERELEAGAEANEFIEELRVAAEDFLAERFRDELDLWVTSDPDELMGR